MRRVRLALIGALLNASCVTAASEVVVDKPKPAIDKNLIFIGIITCNDPATAVDEMFKAIVDDCIRYKMTPVLYERYIQKLPCGSSQDITLHFVYQCEEVE